MARVLLGVSGSIAAYKAPLLVRELVEAGHQVRCVISQSAEAFVTPLSLATVSGFPVLSQETFFSPDIPHLQVERESDVLLVAPTTANMLAKFALGLADDVLSTVFLAFRGPRIVAPAMHTEMWDNPVVQEHVARLRGLGVWVIGPDAGDLACGDVGVGRMVDISLLVLAVQARLMVPLDLRGQRIVITAGGTREAVDSMRVITNRSTGQLGEMLAHLALLYGAEVRLISTVPVAITHPGLDVTLVSSFEDMRHALHDTIAWCSTLFMAAAVSDFTVEKAASKIKRTNDGMMLSLQATDDLLASVSDQKGDRCFVGFCLEDENLLEVAKQKLIKKNLDFIVANGSESVGSPTRTLYVIARNGEVRSIENGVLPDAAHFILKWT
jgi:phosphopantothenoylcysteine decarboxylase/phosphopantothenate--cysteine ligase